jgi:hypothetical protein
MKFLLLLVMVCLLPSCGNRNKTKECRNKEHMTMQCQTINTPNYGRYYAQEMCQRKYSVERCY